MFGKWHKKIQYSYISLQIILWVNLLKMTEKARDEKKKEGKISRLNWKKMGKCKKTWMDGMDVSFCRQ